MNYCFQKLTFECGTREEFDLDKMSLFVCHQDAIKMFFPSVCCNFDVLPNRLAYLLFDS